MHQAGWNPASLLQFLHPQEPVLKVPACEFTRPTLPGTHWTYASPVNLPEDEKGEE